VAYAALYAAKSFGGEAVLWICPSDHLVLDVEALLNAVHAGLPAARAGCLVTFGITPSRAETGFGWIATGEALAHPDVCKVERFVEKPPRAQAEAMLRDGGHLWNSGMFLMRADVILEELRTYVPDLLVAAEAALATMADGNGHLPDAALYQRIPWAPIDKAVMERSSRVAVVPCDPRWSDVGSWQALWELMPKDGAGNALSGDALAEASADNLVRTEHRLVVLAGVRNLAVVETADAVLVGDLANAEAVKAAVGRLAQDGRSEASVHSREHRPWGMFTNLATGAGFRVREVVVDPGGQLTLQRHDGRDEHWIVVEGRALVRLGSSVREVPSGHTVFVPRGTPHRLANAASEPLRVIEVQMGETLTENATVRLEEE
jgi:mannose-1-phosphate guanylyltransferase/mannose-6-phosphate isomerase